MPTGSTTASLVHQGRRPRAGARVRDPADRDREASWPRRSASDVDFVTEAARHLLDAGGKRFRPLLVLLAAEFGDPDADGVVPAALVVELTHLATLYHDDVMDEAQLRRGAPSANARWDNSVAILTGDFLFARASDIVADLGPEAVRIQAQTFSRLVQGQIRETTGPGDDDPLRALPVGGRRQDRLADRRLGADGRAHRRCEPGPPAGAHRVRRADRRRPSSCPTTSSTSPATPPSRARRRAPTCARACRPCRCCSHCAPRDAGDARLRSLLAGDLSDDGSHAEALACCARTPPWTRPATDVLHRAERRPGAARRAAGRLGPRRARRPLRPRHHPHLLTAAAAGRCHRGHWPGEDGTAQALQRLGSAAFAGHPGNLSAGSGGAGPATSAAGARGRSRRTSCPGRRR